ncbi:MAG TPA: ATP-binding cassette domain-containing protein, partial [candidate division Zixibacteria bacterium]|nr:ATP-binding cassette domain-containing protein [candidate division Zixibacteria bacterium]
MYRLSIDNLAKRFGSRKVFQDISIELATGQSLAVIGPNGSGKSTLVRCLLGLHRPSKGSVAYYETGDGEGAGRRLGEEEFRARAAFVSPYLNLYGQLSGEENIRFFAAMRGLPLTGKQI